MSGRVAHARHAINRVDREVEAVGLIANRQLQRRIDTAELFVAADMKICMIGAPIGELVNQPRVAVEVEDDGLAGGEEAVEVAIGKAVRMLAGGLQLEQ